MWVAWCTRWGIVIVGLFFLVIAVAAVVTSGLGLAEGEVPTPTPAPIPTPVVVSPATPSVETTFADILVWRFCSSLIAGTLEEDQFTTLYILNVAELSNLKVQSLQVVELVRQLVNQGQMGQLSPRLVEQLDEACWELRRVDSERAGWGK